MKIKQYVAFALIGLALGGCNKPGGDDPDVIDPEGELVKAKLAISVPRSVRTYAPGDTDPLATDDEIVANTIDVFIYDDGGSYALTYYRFAPTAPLGTAEPAAGFFNYNGTGDQFLTADFDVREGPKLVYVGVNLPDFIVDRLKTGYYINEIYEQTDLIDLLTEEIETTGSAEVAFFNTAIVEHDVTADGAAIPVSVSRLVAKVVVMADGADGASWDVNGGTVSDLEFAIGQRNNQMFVSPLVGGADPNFLASTIVNVSTSSTLHPAIQKLQFVRPSDYIPINGLLADAGDGAATNMRYATENTSEEYRHQDVTYVSIRAKFIPHRLGADADTGTLPDDGTGDNSTEIPGGFYAVFTGDPTGDDALGVRYFSDINNARGFVTGAYFVDQVGSAITASTSPVYDDAAVVGESDHYIFFYEDSYCYYRIYLNPNLRSDGDPGTGTGNYNILRNTVYLATITGVNYIGTTRPNSLPGSYENHLTNIGRGTPTWPGAWFPNPLPNTPVLPTAQIDPLDLFTGLSAGITLDDWLSDDQDYEVY